MRLAPLRSRSSPPTTQPPKSVSLPSALDVSSMDAMHVGVSASERWNRAASSRAQTNLCELARRSGSGGLLGLSQVPSGLYTRLFRGEFHGRARRDRQPIFLPSVSPHAR